MITRKNYYDILGVTPDSDDVELKSAYRKLARKYHPDLNKNDPESAKKFIEISEAYDTLNHIDKRKQYDMLNGFFKSQKTTTNSKQAEQIYKEQASATNAKKEENKKTEPKNEHDKHFSNVINNMFDEFSKSSRTQYKEKREKEKEKLTPKRGEDINTDISISLKEAVNGTTRTVNIMHTLQCPSCLGRKFINGASCMNCKGQGDVVQHKKISVKIPKGTKNGAKLRINGEGNSGIFGGKNGDLYLSVKIEGGSKIKYDGANILYSVPITPFEAVLGGDIAVPTFDGNIMLKVPPHTNSGQKFRLTGQGLTLGGKSGDMIVTVHIEIPASLSEDEIRLYEKLKKLSNNNLRENLLNE